MQAPKIICITPRIDEEFIACSPIGIHNPCNPDFGECAPEDRKCMPDGCPPECSPNDEE